MVWDVKKARLKILQSCTCVTTTARSADCSCGSWQVLGSAQSRVTSLGIEGPALRDRGHCAPPVDQYGAHWLHARVLQYMIICLYYIYIYIHIYLANIISYHKQVFGGFVNINYINVLLILSLADLYLFLVLCVGSVVPKCE